MKNTFRIFVILTLFLFCFLIISCEEKTTKPDETPPTIMITYPLKGDVLTEPLFIKVEALDNERVEKVEFIIDGEVIGEDKTNPFQFYWNIAFWDDGGMHSILAKAVDPSGNVGISDLIYVTIPQSNFTVELLEPVNDGLINTIGEVQLSWYSFPGTEVYSVELSSDSGFANAESSVTVTDTFALIQSLSDGWHYWRVKAQNSLGMEVEWSLKRRFFVAMNIVVKTYGGPFNEEGVSIQQTNDGGFVIIGYTNSYGAGSSDIWLIKTDMAGNEEWNKTFGGIDWDSGYSIVQTTDGGYVIVGVTNSFGAGSSDIWLIKTDMAGNEEWNKTFGGLEYDIGYCVQQTSEGGYIITGSTRSYGSGSYDAWLIKTDASGNEVWNHTFGWSGEENAYSVQQTADGGYIIGGATNSYGSGSRDILVIKTDINGNNEWNHTYGGTNIDICYSIQQTNDTGFIIAGYTASDGFGSGGILLIKTDISGNEEWIRTYGETDSDFGTFAQQTLDEGYIITGVTEASIFGLYDIMLIKTNASGDKEWQKVYGGLKGDWVNCVRQTMDRGYVMIGSTSSFGVENSDCLLIKTDSEGRNVFP